MRAAFSLIELLVVIVIVVVLAGMLLPGIRIARDSARSLHCASNERQLMLGVLAYAEQWNGVLPYSQIDSGCVPAWLGTGTRGWSDQARVGGYVDDGGKVDGGNFPNSSSRRGIWCCPADSRSSGGFSYSTISISYGVNRWICPATTTTTTAAEIMMSSQLTALARLRSLDRIILLIDTQEERWQASNTPGPTDPPTLDYSRQDLATGWWGTTAQAPYTQYGRHRNAANGAFLDGHVEILPNLRSDVLNRNLFVNPADIP